MRYVVTGGGTGGHVTPIRHVVASLKQLDPRAEIAYVGQKHDRFADMITNDDVNHKVSIFAGKYRRYDRPVWQTIVDIPTHLKNASDLIYVAIGCAQSWRFLRKYRPDALFVKGGFVSVPVGLVAARMNIPIITHDSDTTAGLANQIVGKWAVYNTVSSGAGKYPYPESKKKVVGVPINQKFFAEVTTSAQAKARKKIGAGDSRVILVVGGSLGAMSINNAMTLIAKDLMEESIEVFHITGRGNYKEIKSKIDQVDTQNSYHLIDFIDDPDLLIEYYKAADLVVSRAGATNTAEIAGLAKPAVIIPGQYLSDQIANAKQLEEQEAAVILYDGEILETPYRLFEAVDLVLKDEELSNKLSDNIHKLSNHRSADLIAKLLFEVANG